MYLMPLFGHMVDVSAIGGVVSRGQTCVWPRETIEGEISVSYPENEAIHIN